ncbi:fibroblast growth factor 23-like [Clinocottus analis]|uniref:fibroblast growth factor 23-like n=1 Tax=Clinocottus analis TaxID=304258 RepID=UPI0035C0BD17
MPPAFFSLILIAIHASVPVDCTPRTRDPEHLLQRQQDSFTAAARADTSVGTSRFYLERSGSMRINIHRNLLVILPVKTATSNFALFDLRRKRFLCLDSKGQRYHSRQKDTDDCLFLRIGLHVANPSDVFHFIRGARQLKLRGAELRVAHQNPPEPSSTLVGRFLGPLVKRQRRSEEVNPSDPLRSQSHPSPSAKDHKDADHRQPDQDQAGAVSKETITSCDDPLRVLQPNGPVSPVKTNIADRAEQD